MSMVDRALRPRLLVIFVRIFVLSGWSSRPYCLALWCSCVSMSVTCGSVDASSSTSSAKRKLVIRVVVVCPSCIPYFVLLHSYFKSLNICSSTALKSRELSGSPCLTPRCRVKLRLSRSVFTVPVWSSYNVWRRCM